MTVARGKIDRDAECAEVSYLGVLCVLGGDRFKS
jgi:hypothetical protein